MTSLLPTAVGSPAVRVLRAVRQYRREEGLAPSLNEIARRTGVRRQHIGRALRQLEREGLLTYRPGAIDAIELVDRCANLSDREIEAAIHGRGGTVRWSAMPAILEAYAVDLHLPDDQTELLKQLE